MLHLMILLLRSSFIRWDVLSCSRICHVVTGSEVSLPSLQKPASGLHLNQLTDSQHKIIFNLIVFVVYPFVCTSGPQVI
jgi:hypothetical protein